MKKTIDEMVNALVHTLDCQWATVTKAEIETADGRKDRSNPICKTASCLYIAYSNEKILYIGETSKSIKRRFISDGSGCHKDACSNWYTQMTHVKFVAYDNKNLPTMHRKLLEQALSIYHSPQFYGART